uniref:Uncharacterized protein n=1 Tax=Arundo donax TaxID=35708 RepID=A0A0A9BGK0_ARUDO
MEKQLEASRNNFSCRWDEHKQRTTAMKLSEKFPSPNLWGSGFIKCSYNITLAIFICSINRRITNHYSSYKCNLDP